MASASDVSKLSPDLAEWVGDEIVKDFVEVQRLIDEESQQDPPEEPYRSLYTARELMSTLQLKLNSCPFKSQDVDDYKVLCANLRLHLGLNYINTEELTRGEELLQECIGEVERLASKVKTASVSLEAYNQLGILWGNWGENQKALEYLLKAKAVYESHIALPPPITNSQWLAGREESELQREKEFEGLHTHTLFYLAQVFGHLDQAKQSALYCQQTLRRQVERPDYDALEWSVSCATLSQYYLNTEHYRQARHCLAAASHVLQRFTSEGTELEKDGVRERLVQAKGDVARCWTKYCISLLRTSRDRHEGSTSAVDNAPEQKLFRFESLEVADVESEVSAELADSCEAAKSVFLFAQKKIEESKQFYSLEEQASGHVEVVQDQSLLYKLLAYFEGEVAHKCRLHKRRIDLLSATLSELNPQHYLSVCRQLTFELAEIHAEMASLKIVQASESPSAQAVGKINRLLHTGITHFQSFVETFKEKQSGELPAQLEPEVLRPILSAQVSCGRLYTQIISPTKAHQVGMFSLPLVLIVMDVYICQVECQEKALGLYQWVTEYHAQHGEEVDSVFGEEVKVCQEMVELLPVRIATLRKEL